jgi:hypothetical protein
VSAWEKWGGPVLVRRALFETLAKAQRRKGVWLGFGEGLVGISTLPPTEVH